MTKEKLVEELQSEFATEFTGIGFNFSQYIQDNVEEGLSGVKGANSVKIVGPDLGQLERSGRRWSCMKWIRSTGSLTSESSACWVSQTSTSPSIAEKTARYGLNVRRRCQRGASGAGRDGRDDRAGSRSPIRRQCPFAPQFRRSACDRGARSRLAYPRQRWWQRLHPAERARDDQPRHRRVLHLSTSATSVSSQSSSVCADATSAARSRKRSSA